MFILMTVRGNKARSAEYKTIDEARLALALYNAARDAVKRRNTAAVVAYDRLYNEAHNSGERWKIAKLVMPRRERVPAELYIYGFEEEDT